MALDKDDQPNSGVTRRKIIAGGAALGGLVWAAPAMKTVGRLGQNTGSVPNTTTTTTEEPTTTSTSTSTTTSSSTTTTTVPQTCDCSFCATVVAGPTTLYFDCVGATPAACDCLCKCGNLDFPCAEADPCTVAITCTPRVLACN